MKTNFLMRIALFACIAALASCTKDEERVTATDTADVVSESLTDSYFEDVDDMSIVAVESDDSPAGGRVASDDRFCAGILIGEGSTLASGRITIDFGTGCTDPRGNMRKGKIILEYVNGPAGNVGFTVVTTTDGYSINGVTLTGTRTIELLSKSETSVKHEITVENGEALWPDGLTSTRESSFTREIKFDEQAVYLDGSASGTNRRGKSYTMDIDQTLIYKRSCVLSEGIYMAVKGIKSFGSEGRKLTIDYGDGACDRSVTVAIGDASSSISVDN
ncbi:MAG TPA: hypothetical protein VFW11_10270 [Cyclobacteriaceae bacterium]|nr:hypothetical protein [Cyclobacteriaceae bacterium]